LLPRLETLPCPRCGSPQSSGVPCAACAVRMAEIDGILSPFKFEGVMRQAIHHLKYKNLRALSVPLAELLRDYLSANPITADVLVPVPLHPKRFRERGYNQSSLLAGELGRLIGLPVVDDCLIRRKNTASQAKTSNVEERRYNMIDAFSCRDERLYGKRVMLIDDVATSGATLNACASALKSSGAVSVWGLAMAREI